MSKNKIPGEPVSIVKNQDMKPEIPIDGGNLYAGKVYLDNYPENLKTESVLDIEDSKDTEFDSISVPNLFSRWGDAYSAFIGSVRIKSGPDNFKRIQRVIMNCIWFTGGVSLFNTPLGPIPGVINSIRTDIYGKTIEGSFQPWNIVTNDYKENQKIDINENNNVAFVTFRLNLMSIPPFLYTSYYIMMRSILWTFRRINLNLNVLQKIVGVTGEGKEILLKELNELLNMKTNKFPVPVKVVDVTIDKNKEILWKFIDMKNQIDFTVPYRGNEISADIDSVTKEIFRMLGIRTDLTTKAAGWTERSNSIQTSNAQGYFEARENDLLIALNDEFAYDIRTTWNINIEWESVFSQPEIEEPRNNEKGIKTNEI